MENQHKTFPHLVFIDRRNYKSILDGGHVTLGDLTKVVNSYLPKPKSISTLTHEIIKTINYRCYQTLFGIDLSGFDVLSSQEKTYVYEAVKEILAVPQTEEGAFYEILPIDNQAFLVIVENGFLHHLTLTKDNCVAFVLACLRCQDQFSCEKSQLNRLFLNLQLNQQYLRLLQVRTGF